MVLKKYRQTNDILFIDASQHFEKVKTQNCLREEDVDKIISTYRERKSEDKYSYLASKEELLENEFNLNIPRYVDTFEEEEKVDLDLTAERLEKINNKIDLVNTTVEKFCKELGIKKPL